jgi:hypothetical protein
MESPVFRGHLAGAILKTPRRIDKDGSELTS